MTVILNYIYYIFHISQFFSAFLILATILAILLCFVLCYYYNELCLYRFIKFYFTFSSEILILFEVTLL